MRGRQSWSTSPSDSASLAGQEVWKAEIMTAGAAQHLEHLLSRAIELPLDGPAGEFYGLMQAANIAVTAYRAAGVFDLDESRHWRDRIAEVVKGERARPEGS